MFFGAARPAFLCNCSFVLCTSNNLGKASLSGLQMALGWEQPGKWGAQRQGPGCAAINTVYPQDSYTNSCLRNTEQSQQMISGKQKQGHSRTVWLEKIWNVVVWLAVSLSNLSEEDRAQRLHTGRLSRLSETEPKGRIHVTDKTIIK